MPERRLRLMPAQHSTILTTPVVIGSDAWIRTMIQGFKVLCPAFRRRRKTWGRENSKPSRIRPFSVDVPVGQRAHGIAMSHRDPTESCRGDLISPRQGPSSQYAVRRKQLLEQID